MKTERTIFSILVFVFALVLLSGSAFGQDKNDGNVKPSIGEYLIPLIADNGIKIAVEMFRQRKIELSKSYDISKASLRTFGVNLFNANRMDDAIEILKLTVEEYPEFARAYYTLGYVYREAGKNELAIENFEKSLKLDSTDSRPLNILQEMRKRNIFSVEEVKRDLEYLYKTLEDSHYDLYMHTKKEVFTKEYKNIYETIKDSLSLLQINRLFAPLLALSMHGHCRLEDIGTGYDEYRRNKGTVFPFDIYFKNNRVMIKSNYSDMPDIVKGDEILSINGIDIRKVMKEIYRHLSGESNYNKNTIIEVNGFPFFYWFVYEESKTFNILLKKNTGNTINIKIDAITVSEYNRKTANKENSTNPNREFKFIGNIAYLHPGAFYNISATNSSMEEMYGKKSEFLHFLDSSFSEISKNKTENLIIDLRGNPGGDNSFSEPMVAYFANKPFRYYSKFSYKTSKITKEYWKDADVANDVLLSDMKRNIMSGKDGELFNATSSDKYQPRTDSLKFKGNVFVLINRNSFSATTSVAAVIQDYGFAYLIGEETADVPSSCGATHQFNLPNTQIVVTFPKGYTIRPNGDASLRGTIPDFIVKDDVLTPEDEILDYTLKLIKEKKYKEHKLLDKSIN
jgi:C-terminal processing protease CtpA/Prc